MNIFPIKERRFKLIGDYTESMSRLKRRTGKPSHLSFSNDKAFIGKIDKNRFELILSNIVGVGRFCKMTGEINAQTGYVKVEIFKVFKILLSFFPLMMMMGVLIPILNGAMELTLSTITESIFMLLLFILFFRYIFIGIFFHFASNISLNKLRDVLYLEWEKA